MLNVFGSQAYGAKNFHLVGVWMQVGGFVMCFVVAIVMLLGQQLVLCCFWVSIGVTQMWKKMV